MRRILGKLSVVSRNISDYDSDVLGAAFSNLAYYCNVLKRPMRAVVLSTRSVNLYRAAEKVSDDFAYHEYAQALFAHSAALYRAKKWNEAHETIDEAVSIFRRLAAVNPDAYQLKLLDVLALCAEVESARSEYEGAAQAVREGLAIVDKLNSETEAYSARAHAGLHTIRALLLERDGNAPGVIEAAGAALEAILPAFKAWPTLNDDLTMRLCANYISRCRRSGVAPDSRIVTKLFVIREEVSQN
jgi:tetratricopeptide (TPR) repeat protein